LEVARGIQDRLGEETKVVAVFDREGDVYSVFHEARMELGLDLLIRAVHDRRIEEDEEGRALWKHVESHELGQMSISVPRGKGTQAREAIIQLCAAPVSIKTPPKRPKAERLVNCLAADSIVAWMVHYLTILGRKTPDLSCTVVFEESEWKAVWVYIHKTREFPSSVPTLAEFIGLVGRLGGHLARKGDGPPGTETLWKGLQRVPDLAGMWQLMAT
jgi:hypothetical protein